MSTHQLHMVHDGRERAAFLHLPANPRVAVLLLHAGASSGRGQAEAGRWLDREGVAVCAPDGLPIHPDAPAHPFKNPRAWSSEEEPVAGRQVDDRGYLLRLAQEFSARLPSGVPLYLVGHSNGCGMAFRLLADGRSAGLFAAAGLYAAHCVQDPLQVTIPLLYANGDSDPVRPFNGNEKVRTPWFSLTAVPVAHAVQKCLSATFSARWLTDIRKEPGTTVMAWSGLAPFEFRLLHGQGHGWPNGVAQTPELEPVLGPSNPHVDLTGVMLDFFERTTRSSEGATLRQGAPTKAPA